MGVEPSGMSSRPSAGWRALQGPMLRRDRARTLRKAGASLLGMAMVLVLSAPFVTPAAAASCGGRIEDSGFWRSIAKPSFSTGPGELTDYGVDPIDPSRLYATNGTVVAISKDGGCKWKETFTGTGLTTIPGSTYAIKQILNPQPALAVLMIEQQAGSSRPSIYTSTDSGETWTEGGAGLPPNGQPEMLVEARTAPNTLFLALDVGGGALDFIYVSTDGGSTWLLRSDLTAIRGNPGIQGISVDDLNPAWVWAWGSGGLYRSTNGGAAFQPMDDFTGDLTTWLAARGGEGVVFLPNATPNPQASTTDDNGDSWFRIGAPGNVTSSDHGPVTDQIAMTAAGAIYAYHAPTFKWLDLHAPKNSVTDVRITGGPEPSLFVHNPDFILRLVAPTFGGGTLPGVEQPGRDVSLVEPPEIASKEASFGPKGRRIELGIGDTRTVTYDLRLPPRPVPLDVFFVIDTSSSMTRTINGLAESIQGIVDGLNLAKIDVQFGLAEYRSYPSRNPPRPDIEENYVYKRIAKLPATLDQLEDAIEQLQADAGGFYDAHLSALYQSVTGTGEDVFPVGISNEADVPPNLDADWREKALRVVINATDERFGRSEGGNGLVGTDPSEAPPPNIRSFEEVAAAFSADDVHHVGLSIGKAPLEDMQRVSRDTGTYATGPVDCDGNGTADVATGQPLVCFLRSNNSDAGINLVPAVVGLLRAVQDAVPVSLDVSKGSRVVRKVTPETHEGVILQTANSLQFDVKYACDEASAGKRFPVKLRVTSDLARLDRRATTTVVCTEEPNELVPITPLIPPLVALAIPPPPPPPAPITQLNPATQAQAQAQAQGAAAHQEQEEPQLATVTAFDAFEAEEETQFAMTSYRDRRELPAQAYLGVGAVAVGMMMSAAYALRQRHELRRQGQRR